MFCWRIFPQLHRSLLIKESQNLVSFCLMFKHFSRSLTCWILFVPVLRFCVFQHFKLKQLLKQDVNFFENEHTIKIYRRQNLGMPNCEIALVYQSFFLKGIWTKCQFKFTFPTMDYNYIYKFHLFIIINLFSLSKF